MSGEKNISASLNKHIVFEVPNISFGECGEQEKTWMVHATVWASITPRRANEALRDEMLTSTNTAIVRIRHLTTISTDMRILYGARIFNIRSIINPNETGQLLEMLVEEGVAT